MLDPATHLGAFFGNAIADWSGSVVIILGTKFLYEVGSAESRPFKKAQERWPWLDIVYRHILLIFLGVTGVGWTLLFVKMNTDNKWGQVVGNLVSEWVQMAGLVFLAKHLVEMKLKREPLNATVTSFPESSRGGTPPPPRTPPIPRVSST